MPEEFGFGVLSKREPSQVFQQESDRIKSEI